MVSFTANFKELPPPLPDEYWATLFGFVLTTGLGVWLTPSLVRWTRTRADTKKSDYHHQKINSLLLDGKLDDNDIKNLDDLNKEIVDAYSKGSMNEIHFKRLKNEVSIYYEEILRKRLEWLSTAPNQNGWKELFSQLKDDIQNAYSKQKITELHYNLLNKKISNLGDKDYGSMVRT